MNIVTKKAITCSLCKKKGHNIRGCKIPKKIASECIIYYRKAFLISFLYCNTDLNNEIIEKINNYNLDSLIELIKKKKPLYDILLSNIEYINNLSDNSFKALTVYYDLNRFKIPKSDMCKILNTVISVKSDYDLLYSYDTSFEQCVEYIKKTLEYENILTKISDDAKSTISLHSINIKNNSLTFTLNTIRIQRLKILRYINTDSIYRIDTELQRQHIQITNYSNEIDDLLERIEIINKNILENEKDKKILIKNKEIFNDINRLLASIRIIHADKITYSDKQCPICYNEYSDKNAVKINCGHVFCNKCLIKCIIDKYIELKHNSNLHIINSLDNICNCAMCRRIIFSIEGNEENLKKYLTKISESRNIENIHYVIS
jgi:hypothetical protein